MTSREPSKPLRQATSRRQRATARLFRHGFDSHSMIMAARGIALLEDFGTSAFRRRLDGMVDELGRVEPPAEAIVGVRTWLVSILVGRARLLDRVKKRPELVTLSPPTPLIVTGVPGAPIGAAVEALVAGRPELRRPSGAPDPDESTEWLSLSMVGYSFEHLLGIPSPEVAAAEWTEIVDLHRLAWAADADRLGADATTRPPVFAGADHLLALEPLRRAHPSATIAVVPVDTDLAIAANVRAEHHAAAELGVRVDPAAVRRRWAARVERSARVIASLDLGGPVLAGGAVVALFDDESQQDRAAQ